MVSVVGPGSGRLVASVTCVARARRIEHQYHTVDDAAVGAVCGGTLIF